MIEEQGQDELSKLDLLADDHRVASIPPPAQVGPCRGVEDLVRLHQESRHVASAVASKKVTPTGSDKGDRCRVKTTPTPMNEFSVGSKRLHATASAMRFNIPIPHRQHRTRLTSGQDVENRTDSDGRL